MLKRILAGIAAYLCPGVCFPIPAGMTADPSAAFGLLGLMANVNLLSEVVITAPTSGTNIALTPAQVLCGIFRMTAGASGGFTITLPSTAAIIAAMGNTIPFDGSFADPVSFMNDAIGQTGTVTAGDASTTITGTATIATNTRRLFMLTVTSKTTITLQNIGSVAL